MALPEHQVTMHAVTDELERIESREILEGLSQLHQMVMVIDSGGEILWRSDPLGAICDGSEHKLSRNLRAAMSRLTVERPGDPLRQRKAPGAVMHNTRISVRRPQRDPLRVDVSAFRVEGRRPSEPLTIAIIRPVENDPESAENRAARQMGRVVEAAPGAAMAVDSAGFISHANQACEELLGRPRAALINKPVGLLLQSEDLRRVAAEVRSSPEFVELEIQIERGDGLECRIGISARTTRHPDGQTGATIAFLKDVTDERHERDALARKVATLESTLHGICHDLRSPLVSLLGFTRLLDQDYQHLFDDTGRHFIHRIEQAGHSMRWLMDDLLELSRIGESGERRSLVDPRAVLLQLQAELKPRLDERGAELGIPASPPLLLCDRTRLYQIFSNLVGNALDHMGPAEQPRIQVEVVEGTRTHEITVRDNGVGIDPESHERIFEPFHTLGRKDEARSSSGIGLAIVRKIAETFGGRVWVESELGRGASFHLTLPRS